MADYETPLMRDLSKILPSILLGLIIAIVVFAIIFVPFSGQYHGNGCIITTSWTIPSYIMQMIRGC